MLKNDKLYYRKWSVNPELKEVVKYAWVMKSYEAAQSELDLLIPDGYPEIIFVLRGAYHKRNISTNEEAIIDRSCVIGIQSQSVLASRINHCYLVGLKLYPWGAYRLLGDRLERAAEKNIHVEDLGLLWLSQLADELNVDQEECAIMQRIESKLLYQLRREEGEGNWHTAATYLKSILEVGGQISVGELAQQHCLSVRQFQRKFKTYCGVSPKKFINIIRFKALYKSSVLQNKLPVDFLNFGYYDQMHFIKDFRRQLDVTPSKAGEEAFLRLHEIARMNA